MSRGTLRSVDQLSAVGLVDPSELEALRAVGGQFAIAVSPHVANRLAAGAQGLRAQFIPTQAELNFSANELRDPIGDEAHSPIAGVVHRYPDRVLLKAIHACPVYCRFCFRREQVGPAGASLRDAELKAAVAWIAHHPQVREVILTGGDPGLLSASRLRALVEQLAEIEHVDVVRLHTRVPVVSPERVGPELISALKRPGVATWIAVHVNHPDELCPEADRALARLVDAGIPVVSQTVLLKGINDDVDTLATLFRALVRRRVKPYYLHHGDLARGTAHFRTSLTEGRAIMTALRGRLSGLCIPTYVLDIPGGFGKVPASAEWVQSGEDASWTVRDWQGRVHAYSGT